MWGGLLANIPSGWALCNGLNGTPDLRDRFIKGAAAAANPGATGGSATVSYTPAGTNSAPAFTGAQGTTSAVTGGTPAGTVSQPTFTGNAVAAASTTSPAKLLTANTSSGVTPVTTATGTVSQPTFTGSALGTHAHTLTPTGTVAAPTFTGTQASLANEPAYYALAFIQKT